MRHPSPSRRLPRLALAAALLIGVSAASAHATGPVADRWEARGDRVDQRLDTRGDHAEARLDARGDRIDERLDDRGERRNDHLDARGDRLERRADHIGQRRQGRRG